MPTPVAAVYGKNGMYVIMISQFWIKEMIKACVQFLLPKTGALTTIVFCCHVASTGILQHLNNLLRSLCSEFICS